MLWSLLLLAALVSPADRALAVRQAFEAHQVTGELVVLARISDGNWQTIVATEGADTRVLPASTFKLPNTLIGLMAGVITEGEVFRWDGSPRALPTWEKDLTLAEALKVSCVPCYQEIARRVGLGRMRTALRVIGYGNQDPGEVVDRFWLDGPLAISPREQAKFVSDLFDEGLPFSKPHQQILKRMMLIEETPSYQPPWSFGTYRLFAKTGWAQSAEPNLGWYVGWIERGKQVYAFATLVRLPNAERERMLTVRKDLTLDVLRRLGCLPPQ